MDKRTFEHNGHVREIAYPELSDVEMAGKVRMLTTSDWRDHEAVVCGARDRILALVKEKKSLEDQVSKLVDECDRLHPNGKSPVADEILDSSQEDLNDKETNG